MSSIQGSGTANYLARWTPDGATLGIGLIQDNGTGVGINSAPIAGTLLYAAATSGIGVIGSTHDASYYGLLGYNSLGTAIFANGNVLGINSYGASGGGYFADAAGDSAEIAAYGNGINAYGTAANGYGVYGENDQNHASGIYGASFNNYGYGVHGFGPGSNGIGVYGTGATGIEAVTVGSATTGINATTTDGVPLYADFDFSSATYGGPIEAYNNIGSTEVSIDYYNGTTTYKIVGNGAVSTIVKNTKGDNVVLHAPETPEVYFEDYGEGQLVNGIAHITLDSTFAQTVTINDKHPLRVFIQLEENENCKGVITKNKTATGFDVVELNGGTSNTPFEWHIVCNRADQILNGGKVSKFADLRFEKAPAEDKHRQEQAKVAKERQRK